MGEKANQNKPLIRIKQESKENYVKAIYILECQNPDGVHYADLENYFGFSKASVCKAVLALKEEGIVTINSAYCIRLTEKGGVQAEKIYKKYCFFRGLLLRAGVEQKQAEKEACKLEHGISSKSLNSLITICADCLPESQ